MRLGIEDAQILTGTCSCPYDDWCKHMVAVAIVAGASRTREDLFPKDPDQAGIDGAGDSPRS